MALTDLAMSFRSTFGDIPPALIGASVTAVGTEIYVIAGRLASNRRLTSDVYMLDKLSRRWQRLSSGQDPPPARYFHSACLYKSRIYVYGGMGAQLDGNGEPYIHDDLFFYDVCERAWHPISVSEMDQRPLGRYAHLSVVTNDTMTIIGGQARGSAYVRNMASYHLDTHIWSTAVPVDENFSSYRSLAVPIDTPNFPSTDTLEARSYLEQTMLYSNYNFAHDTRRELYVLDHRGIGNGLIDVSHKWKDTSLPPGLRFPSGFKIDSDNILLLGVHLETEEQTTELWALNSKSMTCTQLDITALAGRGSWTRGCFCAADHSFVLLGNLTRSLADDYSHRQASFEHMVTVDLEAHGLAPSAGSRLSQAAVELGLLQLSDACYADLDIVTQERTIISVSSRVLATRWRAFRDLYSPLPSRPASRLSPQKQRLRPPSIMLPDSIKADAGQQPRCLYIPYNHVVVAAFVRFLYSGTLPLAFEESTWLMCSLLALTVAIDDAAQPSLLSLVRLCTSTLNSLLTSDNARQIFEAGVLTGQRSLQVRALQYLNQPKSSSEEHQ